MFDIGFWEVLVITVVALVVVGPERFPALVRTLSSWIRNVKKYAGDIKNELEVEVSRAEQLKTEIAKETEIAKLQSVIDETKRSVSVDLKKTVIDPVSGAESVKTDLSRHSKGRQPDASS